MTTDELRAPRYPWTISSNPNSSTTKMASIPMEMPHHRRNIRVSPEAFRQRVRSFPRDRLLRAIAHQSALDILNTRGLPIDHPEARLAQVRQGMLFAIGGISATSGNNDRSKAVDRGDVQDLLDGFHGTWERTLGSQDIDAARRSVLSRGAYTQFRFQLPPMESLARCLCLFGDDPRFGDPLFEEDKMRDMLGVTLLRFLYLGLAMYTFAIARDGRVGRSELLNDCGAEIFAPDSAEHSLGVIDRWLAAPADALADIGRRETPDPSDLWGFNPLFERPIVAIGGDYVVPCPGAILQRLSPQGLLFVVRDSLSAEPNPRRAFRAFTQRLGSRFEAYIGEQLRLLEHATVTPEISYEGGKLGVDYIVETPEVVLLVEVKAIAPTLATRAGRFLEDGDVATKIRKACDQIAETAGLLESRHEAFPSLNGRPVRGLVVTRDPYYLLDAPFFDDAREPMSVPTTFIGSHELERVLPSLMHDAACGARLLDVLPNDLGSVGRSLRDLPQGLNPLLSEVFDENFTLPLAADSALV